MHSSILITGGLLGFTAILLGAFGAHAFKKILSPERLASFEVGVRYQMYGALTLLFLAVYAQQTASVLQTAYYTLSIGTVLFSGSIYLLSFSDYWKIQWKWLGPITPLGGLFILIGWGAMIYAFCSAA